MTVTRAEKILKRLNFRLSYDRKGQWFKSVGRDSYVYATVSKKEGNRFFHLNLFRIDKRSNFDEKLFFKDISESQFLNYLTLCFENQFTPVIPPSHKWSKASGDFYDDWYIPNIQKEIRNLKLENIIG